MRSLGFFARAVLPRRLALEFDFEFSCAQADMMLAAWSRTGRWHHLSLPVRTVLFRAETCDPSNSADLGWGRYCPDLAVESTPGTHFSMMEEPHLQYLSGKLADRALTSSEPFLVDLS